MGEKGFVRSEQLKRQQCRECTLTIQDDHNEDLGSLREEEGKLICAKSERLNKYKSKGLVQKSDTTVTNTIQTVISISYGNIKYNKCYNHQFTACSIYHHKLPILSLGHHYHVRMVRFNSKHSQDPKSPCLQVIWCSNGH